MQENNKNQTAEQETPVTEETVTETVETEETVATEYEETAKLQAQIAELEEKLAKQEDVFKRTAAEYDNYRKRTAREMSAISADAKAEVLKELLPVVDNLERAVAFQDSSPEDIRKGLEMVMNQLLSAFGKLGVEAIEGQNIPFDPNMHNAVMHIEDEELEQNTVAETFQKGYKMGDKILRYAMVKVAN